MKKEISILDLLALLEVFNEYAEFEEDLNKLLNNKNSINSLYKIRELANGEKVLCSRNIKNFYKKHKNTIKKIIYLTQLVAFQHTNYYAKDQNK